MLVEKGTKLLDPEAINRAVEEREALAQELALRKARVGRLIDDEGINSQDFGVCFERAINARARDRCAVDSFRLEIPLKLVVYGPVGADTSTPQARIDYEVPAGALYAKCTKIGGANAQVEFYWTEGSRNYRLVFERRRGTRGETPHYVCVKRVGFTDSTGGGSRGYRQMRNPTRVA